MTDTCIIFTHIPKTGGVSFINLIKRQFKSNEILLWWPTKNYPIDAAENLFSALPRETKLIQDHIPFGIHSYLPLPATYITFLREPIKRTISDYNFWYWINHRNRKINHIHDLEYFCEMTGDNLMTRFISGLDLQHVYKLGGLNNFRLKRVTENAILPDYCQQCPPEMLEIAKKNLKNHFSFIGITERFDESLVLLKRNLAWKNIYYYKKNVAPYFKRNVIIPKKKLDKTISDNTLNYIKKQNQLDIELYKYVLSLFEEQIFQAGTLFQKELKTFQFQNPIYSFPEYISENTGKITHKIKFELNNVKQKLLSASNSKK